MVSRATPHIAATTTVAKAGFTHAECHSIALIINDVDDEAKHVKVQKTSGIFPCAGLAIQARGGRVGERACLGR